jgi:hypothetical protein
LVGDDSLRLFQDLTGVIRKRMVTTLRPRILERFEGSFLRIFRVLHKWETSVEYALLDEYQTRISIA